MKKITIISSLLVMLITISACSSKTFYKTKTEGKTEEKAGTSTINVEKSIWDIG